jgi:hypothetical protein
MTVNRTHFRPIEDAHGLLADQTSEAHPHRFYGFKSGRVLDLPLDGSTAFGFVQHGDVAVVPTAGPLIGKTLVVHTGMYFSIAWSCWILGGQGFVVERVGFHGTFMTGGPIEPIGRLRYIDGCTDSLLIAPIKHGDACLNFLHFPAHIAQTRHTHPSNRVGIVTRGSGRCVVPTEDDGSGPDVTIPLTAGMVFIIPTDGQHSFFTDDEGMDVIAFHPDSDFGATDQFHPMVQRTMIDGV